MGQEAALKFVSVAIFKHASAESCGNLLLIGNSGTGKTSIMRAIEGMYATERHFEKHRVVVRMNANTLASEEGAVITGTQLLKTLQERATRILGKDASPSQIRTLMEHATICVDEVDKISATVGKMPNPVGLNLQQSLLTLMEDEAVVFDTHVLHEGKYKPVQMQVQTAGMLFLCGGAFEELYDQVYARVVEEGKQESLGQMVEGLDGNMDFKEVFKLEEHLIQEDLFRYGIMPQFLSRFESTLILKELKPAELEQIFRMPGGLFETSRAFFRKRNVELVLTPEASRLIAERASLQPRVGARALKDVYSRVIQPYEFDPDHEGALKRVGDGIPVLTLTEDMVKKNTKLA